MEDPTAASETPVPFSHVANLANFGTITIRGYAYSLRGKGTGFVSPTEDLYLRMYKLGKPSGFGGIFNDHQAAPGPLTPVRGETYEQFIVTWSN